MTYEEYKRDIKPTITADQRAKHNEKAIISLFESGYIEKIPYKKEEEDGYYFGFDKIDLSQNIYIIIEKNNVKYFGLLINVYPYFVSYEIGTDYNYGNGKIVSYVLDGSTAAKSYFSIDGCSINSITENFILCVDENYEYVKIEKIFYKIGGFSPIYEV